MESKDLEISAQRAASTGTDAASKAMAKLQHCVEVGLAERSYRIHIGQEIFSELPVFIAACLPRCIHAVVVSDAKIGAIATKVVGALAASGMRITAIAVQSGEQSKSVDELHRIWKSMLSDRTDRGSAVVAVGGGVIGDLAGFAAATYARGLPLIQIPTTLLSQVDSSVGGKTGINLPDAKNIVGAFWQPSLVVIDTNSLRSLPEREFVSGLAEVVKYGVILQADLFEFLELQAAEILKRNPQAITHIVSRSCEAKAKVVRQDERETSGLRAILNYGHTFAHAIETVAGYGQLLHGEAVAIGMHMAAHLAKALGRTDEQFVQRQRNLLEALNLPIHFDQAVFAKLWPAMQLDKKTEYGKLRFVLPTQLGHVELVADVERQSVEHAIAAANAD